MKAGNEEGGDKKRKVRVPFRRNRSRPARRKDWSEQDGGDARNADASATENVAAKGHLSRQRTIMVGADGVSARGDQKRGVVIAVRGLFADVDMDRRIIPCTVRRVLRTRLISGRNPVTVGDRVYVTFEEKPGMPTEGVIEGIAPRRGELRRRSGKRIHTMAANVEQAIIVSSAWEPMPKPQLIDRYVVACLAGDITPIICMNKMDLDAGGGADMVLERYAGLHYRIIRTSTVRDEGIGELRDLLRDKISVIAGQSGVGKSSLLNVVQPGLGLLVGAVGAQNEKGRHTTTTAVMIPLAFGGYVVDTPGIRSFDIGMIAKNELEAYFEEFVPFVTHCKYPNCTHTHEDHCAVKEAVEGGHIHPERYESYVYMFADPG